MRTRKLWGLLGWWFLALIQDVDVLLRLTHPNSPTKGDMLERLLPPLLAFCVRCVFALALSLLAVLRTRDFVRGGR